MAQEICKIQIADRKNVGLDFLFIANPKYLHSKTKLIFVPKKLDDCVAKVKAKGEVDNPWAVCNASIGKEAKTQEEIAEAIIQEKVNANRQVPLFNPPITNRKVEPDIQKTTKGIGGQVGKIDSNSNTNNMTTALWKKILDAQLRRNVKEPRY